MPPPRRSQRLRHHIISQEAINFITHKVFTEDSTRYEPAVFNTPPMPDLEHFAGAGVVHPTTGVTITKYRTLATDPATRDIWTTAFGKELGSLAQGDNKTGTKGTNTIVFLDHQGVRNIPKDRTITYARVVVDYRPQKADPNRVRITVGGNLIDYPGELTTNTADLVTSKILWNSVLSTPDAKYMTVDIKNFYLNTPLDRYEYMRVPLELIPQHIIDQYDLTTKAKNGFVYCEIQKGIYGLPQAGILANKLLKKRLAKFGYFEVPNTPGLWRHIWRPIQFTLVVDDFGVKYVGKEHAQHLCHALHANYDIAIDWTGDLYCGIKLSWDYTNRTVDLSMPVYIKRVLQKYKHLPPSRPQHCPYQPQPKKYGKEAQDVIPPDVSDPVNEKRKKQVQQIVGSILWYAQAVDLTVLMALSTIAGEQANATKKTERTVEQLLDYLSTHPDATIRYRASDMVLNIHSDASYLSEAKARSRACGHYFLGWVPEDKNPSGSMEPSSLCAMCSNGL